MAEQTSLAWLDEAFKHNNLKEVPGPGNNKTILFWLEQMKAWWKDDATPWCGLFVGHCLKVANRPYPKNWFRALEYRKYGTKLDKPAYGCIATTVREGGGHVFFVVGVTSKGDIVGYGGNQSDAVNMRVFQRSACMFTWPDKAPGVPSVPAPIRYDLPVYNSNLSKVTSVT